MQPSDAKYSHVTVTFCDRFLYLLFSMGDLEANLLTKQKELASSHYPCSGIDMDCYFSHLEICL